MIRVEIDETIDRSIEEVFQQLVDIARYPEWMPEDGLFISCTQDTEGPVREGTKYTDRTRLGAVEGEVSELERPRRVVFHYTARFLGLRVMDGWPGYTLERAGDGRTRVHHVARGHLHGPFRILTPMIQGMARRERQRTVDALKASLEEGAGGAGGG